MAACRQCGVEIPDESRFCPNCGTAVASSEDAPNAGETPQSEEIRAPQPYRFEQSTQPEFQLRPQSEGPSVLTKDARNMAMLVHLSAFSMVIIPFGYILGPLFVWLLKREEYPFVDRHGKAAMNFQISMTIYFIVSVILVFVVIGIFLLIALVIFDIVLIIVAAVKASNGEEYEYPLAIKFIK